jgi:hypothetical protein
MDRHPVWAEKERRGNFPTNREGDMATAANLVLADETEKEGVIRWRLEQLSKAGFSWPAAMVLAANNAVDLHRAVWLVECGCPPETAARILL